jgi:predicted regulator of Ras-like GTPase activity (Roadblock/LC7/MglB family)
LTNIASEDIDDLSFLPALKKAAEKMWCGILRIMKGSEQIGAVYMRDGKIAWAVSRNQTENFGSFLERIGMIPKEQHAEIINKYKALGKSKKLGALFEEAGLITHSKLRECLIAHIRAAIICMLNDDQVVVNAKCGEINVDSNLLFLVIEVLPNYFDTNPTPDHSQQIFNGPKEIAENDGVLRNLASLPGYQYSFISGSDGKLLAFHKSDNMSSNIDEAITSAIYWINSSKKNVEGLHLEKMEFIFIEHEKGSLIVQWSDVNLNYFIAASFSKSGKLGVIKHKINELIPTVRNITEKNNIRQEN